jgi:hypothetical protein
LTKLDLDPGSSFAVGGKHRVREINMFLDIERRGDTAIIHAERAQDRHPVA